MLSTIPLPIPANNQHYNDGFQTLIADIMKLHDKQFKQEGVKGESDQLLNLAANHSAMLYAFLLYNLNTNPLTSPKGLDYWKTLYNYEAIKSCLLDKGIDLDLLLLQTLN